nr:retina-specific 15.7 kDa protein [Bos taurus]prf//1211339A protein,retina specific [Bos taurus]
MGCARGEPQLQVGRGDRHAGAELASLVAASVGRCTPTFRKPFHTDSPSIQGQWHPFTNKPTALGCSSRGPESCPDPAASTMKTNSIPTVWTFTPAEGGSCSWFASRETDEATNGVLLAWDKEELPVSFDVHREAGTVSLLILSQLTS